MPAIDFPAAPTEGQTFVANGLTYTFQSGAWVTASSTDPDVRYVNTTGDTMTGALQLPAANPTGAAEAAHKSYVDAQVATRLTPAAADTAYVNVTGDTMTGALTLAPATGPALIQGRTSAPLTAADDTLSIWARTANADGGVIGLRGPTHPTTPNGVNIFAGTAAARKGWDFKADGTLIAPGNITIPQGNVLSLNSGIGAHLTCDSSSNVVLQIAPGYYMARWASNGNWAWAENGVDNFQIMPNGDAWARKAHTTPNLYVGGNPGNGLTITSYYPTGPNWGVTVSTCDPTWGPCYHLVIHVTGLEVIHRFQMASSQYFDMRLGGSITRQDGYWVSFTAPSDVRMKQNIQPSKVDALALINQIEMVEFDWTDAAMAAMTTKDINHEPVPKARHVELGAVAQQVAALRQSLTTMIPRSEPREGVPDDPLSVDWGACMPYVMRALQQIVARIEALEKPA